LDRYDGKMECTLTINNTMPDYFENKIYNIFIQHKKECAK
jgi:hypothetical protein